MYVQRVDSMQSLKDVQVSHELREELESSKQECLRLRKELAKQTITSHRQRKSEREEQLNSQIADFHTKLA